MALEAIPCTPAAYGHAYSAVVKGGWNDSHWGVMVSCIPKPKPKPKKPEEMRALMKQMQLKFVVIGYDGTITFPEEEQKAEPNKK